MARLPTEEEQQKLQKLVTMQGNPEQTVDQLRSYLYENDLLPYVDSTELRDRYPSKLATLARQHSPVMTYTLHEICAEGEPLTPRVIESHAITRHPQRIPLDEQAIYIRRASPEVLSQAMFDYVKYTSHQGHAANADLLKMMMDHGADPTITWPSGVSAVDYLMFPEIRHTGKPLRGDGSDANNCVHNYNFQGIDGQDYLDALFSVATHPRYPSGLTSSTADTGRSITKREQLHHNLMLKLGGNPLEGHQSGLNAQTKDEPGTASTFASMMHVYSAALRLSKTYNAMFNERDWPPKDGQFYANPEAAKKLLHNRSERWIEQSNLLKGYPTTAVDNIANMIYSYSVQNVLPGMRYHIKEAHLEKTLASVDAKKLANMVTSEVRRELMQEKTLFELLEISKKWHKHSAKFDLAIRTIPRLGKWHPLLDGAPNNTLIVSDGPAQGDIIRNITEEQDLWQVGKKALNCIGGKGFGCRKGEYHAFSFEDKSGYIFTQPCGSL